MSDESRKIAAILFSDIVGYTAAMGRDEEAAIRAVSRSRSVQKELVRKHRGQWLQEIGDGAMCTFDSAVEAVRCALEIQGAFREEPDFQLRIGIHVGDLVFRKTEVGTDIFGDAVNVAARIQGVADEGGICISERVRDDLLNRPGFETRFLGEKQLKNVNRPIRVYELVDPDAGGGARAEPEAPPARSRAPLAVVALALGIALAGAVWWLSRGTGPSTEIAARETPAAPEARPVAPEPQEPAPARAEETDPAASAGDEQAPAEAGEAAAEEPAAAESTGPEPEPSAGDEELEKILASLGGMPAPQPPAPDSSFAEARGALLSAVGPWADAGARIWTEPDPVPIDATYSVRFEAQCECSVLLFAVDGTNDEIALLYPNAYEPPRRLEPGEVLEIPSEAAAQPYVFRAVGGTGMDVLKLFVTAGDFDFPPAGADSWAATPGEPEQIAVLERFLGALEGRWATAETALHIAR